MADGFQIVVPVVRSYQDGNLLYVEGAASDCSEDMARPAGRMAASTIFGFVNCVYSGQPTPVYNADGPQTGAQFSIDSENQINPYPVAVDNEHSEAWPDQIGYAVEAKALMDASLFPADWQALNYVPPIFWVKLAVDLDYAHGRDLAVALAKGRKLGLSIAGEVVQAHNEVSETTGMPVQVFDLVTLKKIAVTKQPANRNTWLGKVVRSVTNAMDLTRTTDGGPVEPAPAPAEDAATDGATIPQVETGADAVANPEPVEAPAPATEDADTPESAAPANVVAEIVQASEPAPEAPAEPAPATVERADVVTVTRAYVESLERALRAEIDAVKAENAVLRGLLADVPGFMDAQTATVTDMREEMDDTAEDVVSLRNELAALRAELETFQGRPVAKKTITGGNGKPVRVETTPELISELRSKGRGDIAGQLILAEIMGGLDLGE